MVSKFVLLIIVVGSVNAAVYLAKHPEKPWELAHKEGCYIKQINDVIPYDSTNTPIGECVSIHCSTSYIQYATCGAMYSDDPKCHYTGQDVSKPYPDCCSNIICDFAK